MPFRYTTSFVTLASPDIESLVQFYSSLFTQSPKPYVPDRYAEFQLKGLRLAIFKPKTDHIEEFAAKTSGGMSLCIEVVNLDEAIAHLAAMGHPLDGQITVASHGREVYAYDPVGTRLILHEAIASPSPEG